MANRNALLGRSRPREKLTREEITALDKATVPPAPAPVKLVTQIPAPLNHRRIGLVIGVEETVICVSYMRQRRKELFLEDLACRIHTPIHPALC